MTLETMTRQPAISAIVPTASALATPLPRVLRPQRAVPADAVRPTRAEVNLANLRHNLRVMQRTAGGAEVWAVLKADGYGHGAKGAPARPASAWRCWKRASSCARPAFACQS